MSPKENADLKGEELTLEPMTKDRSGDGMMGKKVGYNNVVREQGIGIMSKKLDGEDNIIYTSEDDQDKGDQPLDKAA